MARMESSWMSDRKGDYDARVHTDNDFGDNHEGKPIKAVIGLALLVILALVLSRMDPVPHDASTTPSITTGQTTGTDPR